LRWYWKKFRPNWQNAWLRNSKFPLSESEAGPYVDGQVLVMHDMLGINKNFSPRFLRRYANLFDDITKAVQSYIKDVKTTDFPSPEESY